MGVAEQTAVAKPAGEGSEWLSVKAWGELSRASTLGGSGLKDIAGEVAGDMSAWAQVAEAVRGR